jgi:feruloyl-CoA synthase
MRVTEHRPVHVTAPNPKVERLDGGRLLLGHAEPLAPHPPHLGHWLRQWAEAAPERSFLAERDGDGGWRRLSYREARDQADRLSAALLAQGLGPERPLAILSGNSIAHALLSFAAIQVGVPVAPLSVAYATGADKDKLAYLIELLRPGMIFAEQAETFAPALAAIDAGGALVIHGDESFEALLATPTDAAVEAAFAATGDEDVAKILFTSGSTGMPKGVVTPNRMLTSNQVAWRQVHPFLGERPPVLVDWLPWNHCFGGSFVVNLALANGGTLYIDPGKPMPGQFQATLDCLAEIAPTVYLNVPAGIDLLLPALETDTGFRDRFFRDLELIFYAGSVLPMPLWERLQAAAVKASGKRVLMVTAYGMTETGPMHTMAVAPAPGPSHVGLPTPGSELLLIPHDGERFELRCRGVNVMPGYFKRDDLNRASFDDEGFLITGDAVRFVDPEEIARGLVFLGRIGSNFKLLTGTWVQTDEVRVGAIAAAPDVIRDALVCGADLEEIGLLIFPNLEGCRRLAAGPDDLPIADLVARPEVRQRLAEGLSRYNAQYPYRSRHIGRVRILDEPPEIYESEITDKTSLNQHAGLERRRALADSLYQAPPPPAVLVFED